MFALLIFVTCSRLTTKCINKFLMKTTNRQHKRPKHDLNTPETFQPWVNAFGGCVWGFCNIFSVYCILGDTYIAHMWDLPSSVQLTRHEFNPPYLEETDGGNYGSVPFTCWSDIYMSAWVLISQYWYAQSDYQELWIRYLGLGAFHAGIRLQLWRKIVKVWNKIRNGKSGFKARFMLPTVRNWDVGCRTRVVYLAILPRSTVVVLYYLFI